MDSSCRDFGFEAGGVRRASEMKNEVVVESGAVQAAVTVGCVEIRVYGLS
jgi:hypothetical protein